MTQAPTLTGQLRGCSLVRPNGVIAALGLRNGQGVLLIREPTNPVHSNAVQVANGHDEPVGYIDWDTADRLAPWMDKGIVYLGTVKGEPIELPPRLGYRGISTKNLFIVCRPLPPLKGAKKIKRVREIEDV